ncbi:MAG: NADH-quinone oxidoreductase subunit J [Ruminococcaceae bacterium]|nr:NADH-quinone oxidoreductase subunit J [Oscillospiraceae bacterium]
MNFEELKQIVRDSGVVGAGGAGFPSYAKFDKSIDTIILNCAECEPLLRLHRSLLEKNAHEILCALNLIAKTLDVNNVIIALKKAYKKAIEAVNAEISSFENISISTLDEIYPAGDEVVLIYETTGRVVAPGAIPSSVGVTVFNVETVYNVYKAVNETKPVTKKFVTITGEVKKPQTFLVPIGMKISEVIELAGGVTVKDPAFVMGGPMMGSLGSDSDYVTKTTNAVIVLPQDHYVVMKKKVKPSVDLKRTMASCCQCRYCTDLCPRFLLGHPIEPHEFMRVVSNHDTKNITPYLDAMFCCGCALCEMYSCQQGLSPRLLISEFKTQMRAKGVSVPKGVQPKGVPDSRKLRRVPLSRLCSRLGLNKYNVSAPISDVEVIPETVRIKMSQHIGVPAVPQVKVGDTVKVGQLIGLAPEGKLGVNIHSSINGQVKEVNDKYIIIKSNGGKR